MQDQSHQGDLKNSESRTKINDWHIALKNHKSLRKFYLFLLGLVYNLCQDWRIKSHTQRDGFSEHLIPWFMIRNEDQCIGCSCTWKFRLSYSFQICNLLQDLWNIQKYFSEIFSCTKSLILIKSYLLDFRFEKIYFEKYYLLNFVRFRKYLLANWVLS